MKSVVAANVKRLIAEKGYKQSAVANKAGYNPKAFSNMMNNRKIITDVDVANIARALDATPGELFSTNDEPKAG